MNNSFDLEYGAGVSRETVYLRKVYAWLTVGLGITLATSWATLTQFGTRVLAIKGQSFQVPNLVADMMEHPIMAALLFLGLGLGARFMSQAARGLAGGLFFLFSAFTGVFIGPALFVAQLKASEGHTLSPNPILHALVLTVCAMVGLTVYVLTTRKDFTAWGGFLMSGLLVLIGASVLGIWIHAEAFHLAVASVGVLLFMGFILFDTSKMLHKSNHDDALGDAWELYMDFINLFLELLRIFASKKD